VILAHVSNRMLQGHPMVPLVQVGARGECSGTAEEADLMDLTFDAEPSEPGDKLDRMLERVLQVASRVYRPKAFASGNTDFQMTRGWLGVSL
jgi:hypothetical protein